MKTLLATALTVALLVTTAHAEVITYACKRLGGVDEYKVFEAKLDTTKKTLTWDGHTYRNVKETYNGGDGCAKACFRATDRHGSISLETATQGVASLTETYGGPGTDGVDEADCDILRKK